MKFAQEKSLIAQPYEVSRASYRCNSPERKLLYFAATKINLKSKGKRSDYVAEFRISEMLNALGMQNSTSNRQQIRTAVKTIAENTIMLSDTEKFMDVMNWIQRGTYDEEKNVVTLVFTNEIGQLFFECKERFSLVNLKVIGAIKSYYAMRYYEIALSYIGFKGINGNPQNSWYFDLGIDEIRTLFKLENMPYAQSVMRLGDDIVRKPVAELNAVNPDFKIVVESLQEGRRTVAYRFNCTEASKEALASEPKKIAQKATASLSAKAMADKEREEFEAFKNEHALEFYTRLVKRLKVKKPYEMQAAIEAEIYQAMKAELEPVSKLGPGLKIRKRRAATVKKAKPS